MAVYNEQRKTSMQMTDAIGQFDRRCAARD